MTLEQMLQAVLDRNPDCDGRFVYAVKTTGIYCRPSCPSRQAKPENMEFLPNTAKAVAAGYRACLKCVPDHQGREDAHVRMARQICAKLAGLLENYDGSKPALAELAAEVGYSEDYVSRIFKKVMGLGPLAYFDALRNKSLKKKLRQGNSVADAAYGAGFGSSSRLYEAATERLGMSPASYAKGGKGAQIAYAIVDCFLGRMLVAGTQNGVCAVYFGDADGALVTELGDEFPQAEIAKELGTLSRWTEIITRYLEQGQKVTLDVPLDIYGTAFQRLVWQELLKIAPGMTKTYHQIATEMGRDKSSRAVGRACATNPVSLIVPCHRVIGSDGKLHGYRWGLDRKAALMAWEQKTNS